MTRYRLTLFNKPRGDWHDTFAAAVDEAIALKLAERDEHDPKRVWWNVGADVEVAE